MKLPIRREPQGQRPQDPPVAENVDLLTSAFARELERWPDFFQPLQEAMRGVLPLADVEESDEAYIVDIELPGVKRDDITLEITGDHLTVTGERRERQRVGLLRQQTRSTGRFRYEVTLPSDVDAENVTATLDHGMLNVVVPKTESARPRKIAIEASSRGREISG